jgi:hypothetical protein
MRHLISLLCAASLIAAGGFVIFMQFFMSHVIFFGLVLGAGTALGFGCLWLWEEISDPAK